MRAVPVLAMGTLLVAACGADEPEITIVAPGATRLLIKQAGEPFVDLEPSDDVRVVVDGPFEIVAVCDPDSSYEPFVHVIRASIDDGLVWNVGRCDHWTTMQLVTLDPQYTDFSSLSVGSLAPQYYRDELWAPKGRQDLFVVSGGEVVPLRDVEIVADAVLPWARGFDTVPLPQGTTATVLTRRGTRFQPPGISAMEWMEPGDVQWITTAPGGGGFTRVATGPGLPEWNPSQIDLELAGAIGSLDSDLSSSRIAMSWQPANSWDDQTFSSEGGFTRWTIEAHRGWVLAEPGRDRELVFDTAEILGWDDTIEPPSPYHELWLGRTRDDGSVVGAVGYGSP